MNEFDRCRFCIYYDLQYERCEKYDCEHRALWKADTIRIVTEAKETYGISVSDLVLLMDLEDELEGEK